MAFSSFVVVFVLFLQFTPGFSALCKQKRLFNGPYYKYCKSGCCFFDTYADPCCIEYHHKANNLYVPIGVSFSVVLFVIFITICIVCQVRKRRRQPGVTIQTGVVPPASVTTSTHGAVAYSGPYSSGDFQTSYPTATAYPATTFPATTYPTPPPYSSLNTTYLNGIAPTEYKSY